ncbi:MAG TPA: hypothetical protein VHD90_04440 [Phototrophicaceae bacterium]|nr:hypothetical protein [Phototrophicaceae bacterium]
MTVTDIANLILAVATLILALATMISVIYIARQFNLTREQAKGTFLLALDDQFAGTNGVTRRLVSEPNFKPEGDEWMRIWQLMSVFERMSVMVDDKILDIALVDRLHGFRLIVIIANDAVYQRLQSTGGEWRDFVHMCYLIAANREKSPDINDADREFIRRVRALDKHARRVDNPFAVT